MLGVNWKYRWNILKEENEKLEAQNKILKRKIKKYENNNTRTTRNRKDNNTTKFGGRVHTKRSAA
jgi:cell division protein FtsB